MGDFVDDKLDRDKTISTIKQVARFEEANDAIRPGPVEEDVQRRDEAPIVWGAVTPAFRLPFPDRPLEVDPNLPHWFLAGDPDYVRRNRYWRAFAEKVPEMRTTHQSVRSHVNAFTSAKQDPQVKALDFQLAPNVDGDIGSMADQVELPEQGGQAVGQLFNGDDTLALSSEDRAAMEGVSMAVEQGRAPGIGAKRRQVYAADRKLSAALRVVTASASGLEGAQLKLTSTLLLLGAQGAETRAGDAQGKIDALRSEVEATRTIIQRAASFFALLGHIAQGGVGDAIEKVGELASEVVSHSRDTEIAAANAEKLQAEVERASFLKETTRIAVQKALSHVRQATHGLAAHVDGVLVALSERRSAYSELGGSVGASVPSEQESSRSKLAAIPSALPIAEMVIAKAQAIREAAVVPSYNEAAGRGLAIAKAHSYPAAEPFIEAARDVVSAGSYGAHEEATWRKRRDQLFTATSKMIGPRPEVGPGKKR